MRVLLFMLVFVVASCNTKSNSNVTTGRCKNTIWNKIHDRGEIVVGVKADNKPFGFRDSDGNLIGIEPDLAAEVADILGVKLTLVPVQSANRMQFLEQGKIDLMMATMSDRADRRKIVGVIQPNYYSSGTAVMTLKALGIRNWEELRGKPVCGKQGAFYNKIIEERYGAKVIAFTGNAEAKQALRDKKCIAWVFDDSSINTDLASGNYNEFESAVPTEDDNPWAIAVPLDELNCNFGRFMAGISYSWLQSGKIAELERKWGIKETSFVANQKERFKDWIEE